MNELIKNIIEHKDSNDPKICFFLMEYIKNRNINSLEELKKDEDDAFTYAHETERFSDEKVFERLYKPYDDAYDDYMACSVDDQNRLSELEEEFLNTDDTDTKYIDIIKIYSILDWSLRLPYHAYNYILEDRL